MGQHPQADRRCEPDADRERLLEEQGRFGAAAERPVG